MKINKIVIVGGGSAGWMTAATLIRKFPTGKNISVIEPSDIDTVGVGESTLGGIRRWTRWIGVDEKDLLRKLYHSVCYSSN
jgi:tryptophan halogenase